MPFPEIDNIGEKIIVGAALAGLLLISPFNGMQFILLAGLPLLFVFGQRYLDIPFVFRRYDLYWVVFFVLGLFSFFWATNPSLIWNELFGWGALVLLMILTRSIMRNGSSQQFILWVLYGVFGVTLLHQMSAIHLEIPFNPSDPNATDWNAFLFKNNNYTTCYAFALYPFVLFSESKNQFVSFFKLIGIALVFNIIYLADARGAMVAFGLLMLFYAYCRYVNISIPKKVFLPLLVLAIFLGGLLLVQNSYVGQRLFSSNYASRTHMIESSVKLFLEHPISGVGFGNWMTEVYQYSISGILPFADSEAFFRLRSHDLFSRILAELGILGFVTFLGGCLIPIAAVFGKLEESTWVEKAACGSLIVYLVTSVFYSDVNFHEQHFSGIQVLAFLSIGIITANGRYKKIRFQRSHIAMGVLSALFVVWFIYARSVHSNGNKLTKSITTNTIDDSINQISALHNSFFNTAYKDEINFNATLGKLYGEKGMHDLANKHFNKAIELYPNDCGVLLSYSKYLIAEGNDLSLAIEYLSKILYLQPEHLESQKLLRNLNE